MMVTTAMRIIIMLVVEVPHTLHDYAAATDGCHIGILLGMRQRVDEKTRA